MSAPRSSDAPLSLLVVDDSPIIRELIMELLSGLGATFAEASDGAEAVEAADRETFDVILMDLQMPVLDGLGATRHIRERSARNARTPIIAVTASVLPDQVAACLAAGMDDHCVKPISMSDLIRKVRHWTGRDNARAAAARFD